MSILSAKHFHDEEAAYTYVEARIWPHGATCPRCGERKRVSKMQGKSTRIGLYKCYACRKPFTVKIGTVFEASHVPMNLWLQAIFLMCASKKGISSNQLHRVLGVTLKTAWFMSHRIREAMRSGDLAPFGEGGGPVEADETFIGREPGTKVGRAFHHKMKVLSLVDRETGRARSVVVDNLRRDTIEAFVGENVSRQAHLMTDEAWFYTRIGQSSPATMPSPTRRTKGCGATRTPTPSKATSRSSSAGCAESTSTAPSGTCTDTSPNSTSGIPTASRSA